MARFGDRNHFASWTGTAPIDACSGDQVRHRLSRAGNRRLNHVLHIAAVVQLRHDTPGRAYVRRKRAQGKGGLEAMRCLKRRLSDAVYRQHLADAEAGHRQQQNEAGPGGHSGATLTSSAADLTPHVGTSDQPQPGPAAPTLPAGTAALHTPRGLGSRLTIPASETAPLTSARNKGARGMRWRAHQAASHSRWKDAREAEPAETAMSRADA